MSERVEPILSRKQPGNDVGGPKTLEDLRRPRGEAGNPVGSMHRALEVNFRYEQSPTPAITANSSRPSRAALLHLIHRLARTTPLAAATIVLASLYLAIRLWAVDPLRVSLWLALVLPVAAHLALRARRFIAGDATLSSRPFRWRAGHTAGMLVLASAFAAGPALMVARYGAVGLSPSLIIQMLSVSFVGASLAALSQASHGRSASAVLIPVIASFLYVGSMVDIGGITLFVLIAYGAIATSAVIAFVVWQMKKAKSRYPRTILEAKGKNLSRTPFRRKVLAPLSAQAGLPTGHGPEDFAEAGVASR